MNNDEDRVVFAEDEVMKKYALYRMVILLVVALDADYDAARDYAEWINGARVAPE